MRTTGKDRTDYKSKSRLPGTFYVLKENRRQKEDQQFIVPWQMTDTEEEMESESASLK